MNENKKPSKTEIVRAISSLRRTIEGNKEVLGVLKALNLKDDFVEELTSTIENQKELLKGIKKLLREVCNE